MEWNAGGEGDKGEVRGRVGGEWEVGLEGLKADGNEEYPVPLDKTSVVCRNGLSRVSSSILLRCQTSCVEMSWLLTQQMSCLQRTELSAHTTHVLSAGMSDSLSPDVFDVTCNS
jgi:hypothetical protein